MGIRTPTRRCSRTLLALATILAFGCGDAGPTDPSPGDEEIATIEVTPTADTLTALGDTVALDAVARDADGNVITEATFTWSSSDDAVATVNDGGIVEAVSNGLADMVASAGDVTGSAELAVAQRVATLTVSPDSVTLTTVGATQQFTASAVDANGNAVEDAQYVWASEDHTVATVDPSGLATAKGSGVIAITATAQDIPGHATLTVDQQIDHVAFRSGPTATTAGEAFDPAIQVEVRDAAGERVEDAGTAITLAIAANPGGATLAGTKTVNAIDGVASFSGLWLDKTGAGYTLAATATGITADTSGTFDVTAAAPVSLAVRTQPADSVTADDPLGVQAAIVDKFDNTVTTATDSLTLTLAAGPTTELKGTTGVATTGGAATFDARLQLAGSGYALTVTGETFGSVVTDTFEVVAAPPHHLGRYGHLSPSAHARDRLDTMHVAVRDTFGNLVDTATTQVSLSVASGYPGASLAGTLTGNAVDGIVQFDSLSIDKPGEYGVLASATGVADTTFPVVGFILPSPGGLDGGAAHTCVPTREGLFCWGSNVSGQLGGTTGSMLGDSVAVATEIDRELTWVAAGSDHTCGRDADGTAYCWGDNASGQLGDGNLGTDQPTPVPVAGDTTFGSLAAGDQHTCGISADSLAYCWGDNSLGQLGTGTTGAGSDVPVLVTDTLKFTHVVAGDNHTCAWPLDGLAYCWGENTDGQLGDGSLGTDASSPVAVSGSHSFSWLDAGGRHTCGIDLSGNVLCWGANESDQLGSGTGDSDTPVTATTVTSVHTTGSFAGQIAAGSAHSCVIKGPGEGLWCWGLDSSGQLGHGSIGGTSGPMEVYLSTALEWFWIGAGGAHTCGFAEDQDGVIDPAAGGGLGEGLHCWGANGNGQLGDGSTTDTGTMSRVVQGF